MKSKTIILGLPKLRSSRRAVAWLALSLILAHVEVIPAHAQSGTTSAPSAGGGTSHLQFKPDPAGSDASAPAPASAPSARSVYSSQPGSTSSTKTTQSSPSTSTTPSTASKQSASSGASGANVPIKQIAQSNSTGKPTSVAQMRPTTGPDSNFTQYSGGNKDPHGRQLPTTVGTVQIRKSFKLFAQQQLIHNLSFRDTPVKEVIAEIARRGNLNIIIDKSVVGKITGELRDVTLNEAMDTVIASAGLQSRILDNNTVVIASAQAMVQLGLNRSMAKAFKLSYAHPYDVATILHASIFNKGAFPDFQKSLKMGKKESANEVPNHSPGSGGGIDITEGEANEQENDQSLRPDQSRYVRGSSRSQTQEGVGFNNAAVDPGSQQIRSSQEINTDYIVEQNGGGTIVIPDVKNRQVVVVGTAEDLTIAEEAIHLIDRRPREVHIQASLVELNNAGIRQLGANLALQGNGASTSLLGNSAAPLVQYLPGLGSPPAAVFYGTSQSFSQVPVTNGAAGTSQATAFTGLLGNLLPTAPTIAGVSAVNAAESGFNFLTLNKAAGGKANIATAPLGLNVSLNLLLQTNKAKVIANPSVVVVDGTETLINISQEVVHKVTSTVSLGVVTQNVELQKAGVFLNVLPRISEDGFISMRLRPQVSAPVGAPLQFGAASSPLIVTLLSYREVLTQEVRVKDGQTLVLGGLFTEQEQAQLAKVPYLAETPIFGALFRNTLKGRNRTELMLLITPKVVEEDSGSISENGVSPTM
jgi:type II secretory pathway component GspD/PulD (secretin)